MTGQTQPRRGATLFRQILTTSILLSLVPLLIMAYQGYHCARMAVIESARSHVVSVLEARLERFRRWVENRRSDLHLFAGTLLAPDGSIRGDQCREHLRTFLQTRPMYLSLTVFDKDGQLLDRIARDPAADASPLSAKLMARLEQAETVRFAPPSPDEAVGMESLVAAMPLQMPGKPRVGYLAARIDVRSAFLPILTDRSGLGRSGVARLVTADGRSLLPGEAGGGGHLVPGAPASNGGVRAHLYRNVTETPVIGASESFPLFDWKVLVEIEQAEGLEWLGILASRALWTGVVVLLLAAGMAWWTAGRVAAPFRHLSQAARRIGAGNHTLRLAETEMRGREARDVAQAFNRMLDCIEEEHRRLVHAASLAAVGELSSSIVHEMRNPLSSIKLNVNALRRRVEGDPDYAELAGIAAQQAGRLEQMLNDLLDYGKPIQVEIAPVPLRNLLENACNLVRSEADARKIVFRIEDDWAEAFTIPADGELLLRALSNLVLNAVQFSPPGGTVRVAAQAAETEGGRAVDLVVADEGPGVPDGIRPRLFEPFFSSREGGTGLGLANVKRIVEYHGGTVGVENRETGGAVFRIRLPLRGVHG